MVGVLAEDRAAGVLRLGEHPYRIRSVLRTVAGKVLDDRGFAGATKGGKWRAGIKKAARTFREGQLGRDLKLVHVQEGDLQGAISRTVSRIGDRAIIGKVNVDTEAVPYHDRSGGGSSPTSSPPP